MNHPLKTEAAKNIGLLALRLTLGATFLLAGCLKVLRIGVTDFVNSSSKFLPGFLPRPIGQTYLYAVPFLEIMVGALLIAGLFTRFGAGIATLMLISFSIAVTGIFINGNYFQVQPNMVYIAAAFLLATMGAGAISVDKAIFRK
ncbi:MAG: DoxX family protein [Planctomycetota bacterium]|nr:DoxX family protein [Planctomycetota bacterium]